MSGFMITIPNIYHLLHHNKPGSEVGVPVYGGRGGGHHVGGVLGAVKLRVPSLVNVGPGARLDLWCMKIYRIINRHINSTLKSKLGKNDEY